MKRVVIVHPEWGIYLGSCMGLGFWSKLDPVGQPSAVTFASAQEAQNYMDEWDNGAPPGVSFHPVAADDGTYASMAACELAGLDGWED